MGTRSAETAKQKMQDLDQALLKQFRTQVRTTGSGQFQDPALPYLITIKPSKDGHTIIIEDTRRRWWGRQLVKHEHSLDKHLEVVDNGPVAMAIMLLEMVVERKIPLG
ncbi:hypothetical protein [Rhizobium laguerreae]|uniref:hypothetical protein n=1 Tax=Rhizobium laguerreae TaxID=1076926 RepID=UPI001C92B0EE|nr:hypothetical protein [Rhizobium laguerreae]MBY3363738.1 hypothetical protein [Rhizobium laguerreae]